VLRDGLVLSQLLLPRDVFPHFYTLKWKSWFFKCIGFKMLVMDEVFNQKWS